MKIKLIAAVWGMLYFICPNLINSQQLLISKAWESDAGTQYFFRKSKTVVDDNNHTYIIGETVNGNGNYDWYLEKYSPEGDLLFARQFDGGVQLHDLAIDILVDNGTQEIYVVGGAVRDTADSMDMCIVKYDYNGDFLWSEFYDVSGGNDIAADIEMHPDGYFFVTGTVKTSDMQDMVLLSYDNTGSLVFSRLYDGYDLHDMGIRLRVTFDYVFLSGGSQRNATTWDFVMRKYEIDGDLVNTSSAIAGVGEIYDLQDMAMDPNRNIYLTGSVKVTGEEDMVIAKLDSNLNVLWEETYAGNVSLGQDKGNSVKVDGSGNVYVTGFISQASQGKDMVLLKYDHSGTLLFERTYDGEFHGEESGMALVLNSSGEPVITGYITGQESQKDYLTVGYDASGELIWQAVYQGAPGMNDIPTDLAFDPDGNLIVTGQVEIGLAQWQYVTLKYLFTERDLEIDTTGYDHAAHEIIVKFVPDIVDLGFVDDLGRVFTDIVEILPDTIIDTMAAKTGIDFYGLPAVTAIRIFSSMTSDDTISITRTGDTLWLPQFWSSFILTIPEGYDLQEVCDSLKTLSCVQIAELNYWAELTAVPPDDDFYNNGDPDDSQSSLHFVTSGYPDAHLNIEPAWDIETGNSDIKVGIDDSGIDWRHPDFSWDGSGTFAGSVIAGGKDYVQVTPIPIQNLLIPDPYGHGTAASGIIGAISNNNIIPSGNSFIAGIAGGDYGAGKKGVSLYAMKMSADPDDGNLLAPSMINSIYEGAFIYQLDLMNYSWMIGSDFGLPPNLEYSSYLGYMIKNAWRNGMVNIAARSQWQPDLIPPYTTGNLTDHAFPACFDEWVISIGGNGTDGRRFHYADNAEDWECRYDNEYDPIHKYHTDIIAPAAYFTIQTLTNNPNNPVDHFSLTSAAAPHATGVAALLMSQQNENALYSPPNLAPEDIENLLITFATPVTSDWSCCDGVTNTCCGTLPVPNKFTGYGKTDAGAILQNFDYPMYQVYHSGDPASSNITFDQSIQPIYISNIDNTGQYNLPPGTYCADRYIYTAYYHDVFPNTTDIIDAWPRYSGTYGLDGTSYIGYTHKDWSATYQFNEDINGYEIDVEASTYIWHVTGLWDPSGSLCINNVDEWIPHHPQFAYSIYTYDPTITHTAEHTATPALQIYPNPAEDHINLSLTLAQSSTVNIRLIDIQGREVFAMAPGTYAVGNQVISLPVVQLAAGMYICIVETNEGIISERFIKN